MAVQNVEIPTENLLNAVVRLPAKEFDRFFEKARELRQKQTESPWTKREIQLIGKLNEYLLSDEEQIRFNKLVEKRRSEKISRKELNELIALTEKSEELNVKRVKTLIKLAKSKDVSLDEVMKMLGIIPPETI